VIGPLSHAVTLALIAPQLPKLAFFNLAVAAEDGIATPSATVGCLLLAQSGHHGRTDECPAIGGKADIQR
jgi:hypothetical protein